MCSFKFELKYWAGLTGVVVLLGFWLEGNGDGAIALDGKDNAIPDDADEVVGAVGTGADTDDDDDDDDDRFNLKLSGGRLTDGDDAAIGDAAFFRLIDNLRLLVPPLELELLLLLLPLPITVVILLLEVIPCCCSCNFKSL